MLPAVYRPQVPNTLREFSVMECLCLVVTSDLSNFIWTCNGHLSRARERIEGLSNDGTRDEMVKLLDIVRFEQGRQAVE